MVWLVWESVFSCTLSHDILHFAASANKGNRMFKKGTLQHKEGTFRSKKGTFSSKFRGGRPTTDTP